MFPCSAPTTPRFDLDVLKAVLHRESMCRAAKEKSQLLIALARAGKPLDDAVKSGRLPIHVDIFS
jgi:hypothetical protein